MSVYGTFFVTDFPNQYFRAWYMRLPTYNTKRNIVKYSIHA